MEVSSQSLLDYMIAITNKEKQEERNIKSYREMEVEQTTKVSLKKYG